MKTFIIILCAIVAGCHGYSYIIPASFKTFGTCFFNGLILPKGDSQMPGVCQNTNCREDGSIKVDGCGRITLPNCTLIETPGLTKPYPDCCEMTYQCTDADGSIYTKEWNQLNPVTPMYPSIFANKLFVPSSVKAESGSSTPNSPNNVNEWQKVPSAGNNQKQDYKMISPFLLQLMLIV